MRIGVFGGSFDPPHPGHRALALAAIEGLELDEVLFTPANRNPNKRPPAAPGKHRVAMVRLLIEDQPNMAVSDLEIARGGPSYAVETMEQLHMARPADYWFLVGADALKDLPNWKQPERMLRICRLGVTSRPPVTERDVLSRLPSEVRERVDYFPMPPIDVSSTDLRARLAQNKQVAPLMDARVLDYIKQHQLYRS